MAETIKAGYYMGPVTGIMWWIKPDGEARVTTRVDRERKAASPVEYIVRDATPMTYAEARAILGDKWPASWPQSEGVAESTAAPATGQAGAGALSGTPSDSLAANAATIKALQDRVRELEEAVRLLVIEIQEWANLHEDGPIPASQIINWTNANTLANPIARAAIDSARKATP